MTATTMTATRADRRAAAHTRGRAFDGKHGFVVQEELRVPGCPLPLLTMLRRRPS